MVEASLVNYAELGVLVVGVGIALFQLQDIKETRKAELLQQVSMNISTTENYKKFIEVLRASWNDLEDFRSKYGSSNNLEMAAKRNSLFMSFNALGIMLREGAVNRKILYDTGGRGMIQLWEKYSEIIHDTRERAYNGDPSYMGGLEYLYDEMVKERAQRGITW
jgi:hypothetical protein